MVRAEEAFEAKTFARIGQLAPIAPGHTLLALDHEARPHAGSLSGVSELRVPSERERGARAVMLGVLLGVVLAALAGRQRER
jgi:hypothetical protein